MSKSFVDSDEEARKSILTAVMHKELVEAYEMLGIAKAKLSKIAKLLDGLEAGA